LALLHLPEKVKYLRKELLRGKELGLSAADLGRREEVADDILLAAARELFWPDGHWPRSAEEFHAALAQEAELVNVAQEIAGLLIKSLGDLVPLRKSIKQQKNLAVAMAVGDIQQQLAGLFYRGFLFDTPREWLRQYGRYLKGVSMRLEKAALDPNRDRRLQAEYHQAAEPLLDLLAQHDYRALMAEPALVEYRWLLEEFRISLFAQSLKTLMPVSVKRLRKQWQEIEQSGLRFSS
jgi:ATP-dependent helicase HrpA